MTIKQKCGWCLDDELYESYHDDEWGTPLFDDNKLFEFLLLEGAQAGLSWITILRKRENYRLALDDFDARKIALYDEKKVAQLLGNEGIIRNRLKIASAMKNAKAFLAFEDQTQSFSEFLWSFVNHRPVQNQYSTLSEVPASTETSEAMSKALKKAGFNFVGGTICYAFMQATGMVNDHLLLAIVISNAQNSANNTAVLSQLSLLVLYLLSWLPRKVSQYFGNLVGRINYWTKSRAYRVTDTNLEICFPELKTAQRQQLTLASLINTGHTMLETPAVWLGKEQRLQSWICEVSGEEILQSAVDRGKGVIVLLPHIGNWELFNVFFARYGKTTALYNPPRQPFLREPMEKIRSHFGHELVATNRQGIARLYKALMEAGVLTILPDQVPASGRFAPFFGEPALTDQLVSRLIRKTNATVICVSMIRLDGGRFSAEIEACDKDVYDANLDKSIIGINKTIEHCVRKNPSQYQWEYKRFRERPAGKEKLYQYGKPETFH